MKKSYYIYAILFVGLASLLIMSSLDSNKSDLKDAKAEIFNLDYQDGFSFKVKNSDKRQKIARRVQKKIQTLSNRRSTFKAASAPVSKPKSKVKAKKIAKKDKKKKDDKKKKKKVVKKVAADETKEDIEEVQQPDVKKDVADNSQDLGTAALTPEVVKQDEIDKTVEEWLNRFYAAPNVNTLRFFISEHESGKIVDATFYTVIEVLLQDNNPILNQLAIVGLDVNQSVRSFQMLVSYQQSFENEKTLALINQAFRRYTKINSLFVLKQIIANPVNELNFSKAIELTVNVIGNIQKDVKNNSDQIVEFKVAQQNKVELIKLRELLKLQIDSALEPNIKDQLNLVLKRVEDLLNDSSFIAVYGEVNDEELAANFNE